MTEKYDAMMRSVNANKELYAHTRDGLSWKIEPYKYFGLFTSETKVRVIETYAGRDKEHYVSSNKHDTRTFTTNSGYSAVVSIDGKKYFPNKRLAEIFITGLEEKPNELRKPLCHGCGETYTWKMRDGTERTICCE